MPPGSAATSWVRTNAEGTVGGGMGTKPNLVLMHPVWGKPGRLESAWGNGEG